MSFDGVDLFLLLISFYGIDGGSSALACALVSAGCNCFGLTGLWTGHFRGGDDA
jgi:hypothetical protein